MRTKTVSDERYNRYKWVILAVSIVITLGSIGFGRFGFTMILPGMKSGLQLNDTQVGMMVTASLIGYLLVSVTCGYLVAKLGFRVVITIFLSLAGVSALFLGLSRGFWPAITASVLLGVGSAGSNIPTMSLLAIWFSKEKRGMAVGLSTSGSSLGLLITGLIIPVFHRLRGTEEGWAYSWYFLAVCITAIAVIGGFLLRNAPETMDSTVPAQNVEGNGSRLKIKQVYRFRVLWLLGSIYFFFGVSYIIYATFFANYLVTDRGFTISRAGTLWSIVGIISVISGFLWGVFSDKAGRKYALALVFLLQCVCYGIFGIWKSLPGVVLSALLFSLTSWSIPAIMAASVGDLFQSRTSPIAFGFITLFFGVGQAIGPVAAGAIADFSGSYSYAFIAAAAFACAGGIESLLLKRNLAPVSTQVCCN